MRANFLIITARLQLALVEWACQCIDVLNSARVGPPEANVTLLAPAALAISND